MSHPFTESTVASVAVDVAVAIGLIEAHLEFCEGTETLHQLYAQLLTAKGKLESLAQLLLLEREIGSADTERPRHLSVVK